MTYSKGSGMTPEEMKTVLLRQSEDIYLIRKMMTSNLLPIEHHLEKIKEEISEINQGIAYVLGRTEVLVEQLSGDE